MMRICATVVGSLTILSACAMSPSGASRRTTLSPLQGTWEGTMTSPDMATASGVAEAPARLTIIDDGSWTLTSSGGAVATGFAGRTGDSVVLEGTMTSGDPMAVGREVSFALKPRGPNALFGRGETFHLGHRIETGIALRRAI
jgi:hypothetical protein